MSTDISATEIVYPDTDGQPMGENSVQCQWIAMIAGEFFERYSKQPDVVVACDLFWYPVEGNPKIVLAPDVFIVFGRPKVGRPSYKLWEENGVAPQVVFEVLSPSNTDEELEAKLGFYERYGVEEYYVIDPETETYDAYTRAAPGEPLRAVRPAKLNGFVSPRLGVRFDTTDGLVLVTPEGRPFKTREDRVNGILVQLADSEATRQQEWQRAEREWQRAEREQLRAEHEKQRAEQERQRAEREWQRAEEKRLHNEKLSAKLRELGVDPDTLDGPGS
ncbi:Uma2 family endonuclease [Fimbriiglobus ruber]|uniref:Putative restriction endonuclease domain-containing protein n=1 Tax=Fimbriiglobus ruber TaxID=1908690 RepID=A0A225DN62_9BACT|nr:Uma2 family endonuclease [Fimbriiglobus ruber]OWK38886.1 hypothetical protein FRUB_06391 [Fimbriiglobus ruber]